ncbi:hypothetical protein FRC02_000996, partial [Tulasnella sp. 418]
SGTILAVFTFTGAQQGATTAGQYEKWVAVTCLITMSVNTFVTTLICWKIWRISRDIPGSMEKSNRRYHAVMHALIESGGIYSTFMVFYAAFKLSGLKTVSTFASYLLAHIVGIVPTLMVIRLHSLPLQQSPDTESVSSYKFRPQVSSEFISMETTNCPNRHNPIETQDGLNRSSHLTVLSII